MFKAISAVMGYSLAMPRMPSVPKSFPKEVLLQFTRRHDRPRHGGFHDGVFLQHSELFCNRDASVISYVLIGAEARQENRSHANDDSAYLDHPANVGYPSD
jgi:hypothetical protein